MGIAYIQSEQFDKAAGRLEEVWEQDQSDPTVGELLAVAYLNSEDRRMLAKYERIAFALINKLARSGSTVTFLVQHSHEKLGWLQGRELNQYCRGRLSIATERVSYVSEKGEKASLHTFSISGREIKHVLWNQDDRRGTFQLKFGAGNYFMATRNRNPNEARMIVELIHERSETK